jgi:hypothetical protein
MRKHYFYLFPLFFAAAAMLVSCTDFFSTSLATWASRDPDKIVPGVNAGNVDELIAMAKNDTDLSLAVLKKIRNAVDSDASEGDKAKLQCAAVTAAVNAVGLGQAVLGVLDDLGAIEGDDNIRELVMDSLDGMKNLEEAASVLYTILPSPDSPAFNSYVSEASAIDLAMAAVILLAGEVKQKSVNERDAYIMGFDPDQTNTDIEQLAVKLAQEAFARQDELSGPIGDALAGLNLWSY